MLSLFCSMILGDAMLLSMIACEKGGVLIFFVISGSVTSVGISAGI